MDAFAIAEYALIAEQLAELVDRLSKRSARVLWCLVAPQEIGEVLTAERLPWRRGEVEKQRERLAGALQGFGA